MLCARVNAVIVFRSVSAHHRRRPENEQQVIGSVHDVLETVHEISDSNGGDPLRGSDLDPGCEGCTSVVAGVPSSACTRTRTSVMVACRPQLDALAGKAGVSGVDPAALSSIPVNSFNDGAVMLQV